MKIIITSALFYIVKYLPNSSINLILLAALKAQGRGWKNSIKNEIEHIVHTISNKKITNIIAVDAGANKGDWSLELIK